jgi:chemotaxis protein MotB
MRTANRTDLASEPSEHQSLLDRQRALEIELLQARQSHRGLKRKHAAAAAASPPPADDSGGEAWMMTYLDMMTLLLVVTMAMLALAGKNHEHARKVEQTTHPLPDAQQLTRVAPPGSLLLVPQVNTPLPAEPAPEEVTPVEVATVPTPPPAAEPEVIAEPKPSVDELLNELPLDQLGDDIEVVSNESSVSFRINSEILFPSGQTDLNLGGLKVLQHLVPVLESVPHKIIVAGHTDDQDIRSSRFPSNWELSGARAGSVVRYLQSNGINRDRLAAVGYADTRPLADNDTAQGRAKNRRVELILER